MISYCSITCAKSLQENIKKRLHYAMPRVPLQQLKQGNNKVKDLEMKDLSINEKPTCHVGTIAKRIQNARMVRSQATDQLAEDNNEAADGSSSEVTSESMSTSSSSDTESSKEFSEGETDVPDCNITMEENPNEFGGAVNVNVDVHHEVDDNEEEGFVGGIFHD